MPEVCVTVPGPPGPVPNAAILVHTAQSMFRWLGTGRHRRGVLAHRRLSNLGEMAQMFALFPLARLIVEVLQKWLVVKQARRMDLAQWAVRQSWVSRWQRLPSPKEISPELKPASLMSYWMARVALVSEGRWAVVAEELELERSLPAGHALPDRTL